MECNICTPQNYSNYRQNILDNDTDIFVITETWLAERDPVVVGEITSEGILSSTSAGKSMNMAVSVLFISLTLTYRVHQLISRHCHLSMHLLQLKHSV